VRRCRHATEEAARPARSQRGHRVADKPHDVR
jgi:hypothetical protein